MARCGYRTGVIHDPTRLNWAGTGDRPIAWSAWYPAKATHSTEPPPGQVFDTGDVIWNAPLANQETYPVVLLSHGTGGRAESLGWLARALAGKGYVVLGASHHGNTGLEPYLPEGFLCWWERATDLTLLLSSHAAAGFLAGRLDLNRVSAVGFSLGGYTVLALAGARTSLDAFNAWRAANSITEGGPKEFPDAADSIPALMENSAVFRSSWARHGEDFTDARIASVLAIAPAPPIRAFVPKTVSAIKVPITLITGGADVEAPTEQCADWIVSLNPHVVHHDLGQDVGHYTFLDLPANRALVGKVDIFTDRSGVERHSVHKAAISLASSSLG